MDFFTISCLIDSTDYDCVLGLEIWLNDQKLFDQAHITEPVEFKHKALDENTKYTLSFVMKGKLPEHTQIDDTGSIIKDARLTITDIRFDEVALGYMFTKQAVYTHDHNGAGAVTQENFYEELGCNGTVSIEFDTPIYLWLLQHM